MQAYTLPLLDDQEWDEVLSGLSIQESKAMNDASNRVAMDSWLNEKKGAGLDVESAIRHIRASMDNPLVAQARLNVTEKFSKIRHSLLMMRDTIKGMNADAESAEVRQEIEGMTDGQSQVP